MRGNAKMGLLDERGIKIEHTSAEDDMGFPSKVSRLGHRARIDTAHPLSAVTLFPRRVNSFSPAYKMGKRERERERAEGESREGEYQPEKGNKRTIPSPLLYFLAHLNLCPRPSPNGREHALPPMCSRSCGPA